MHSRHPGYVTVFLQTTFTAISKYCSVLLSAAFNWWTKSDQFALAQMDICNYSQNCCLLRQLTNSYINWIFGHTQSALASDCMIAWCRWKHFRPALLQRLHSKNDRFQSKFTSVKRSKINFIPVCNSSLRRSSLDPPHYRGGFQMLLYILCVLTIWCLRDWAKHAIRTRARWFQIFVLPWPS